MKSRRVAGEERTKARGSLCKTQSGEIGASGDVGVSRMGDRETPDFFGIDNGDRLPTGPPTPLTSAQRGTPMIYVLMISIWVFAMVAVTEFSFVNLGKETDRSPKKPFGCC